MNTPKKNRFFIISVIIMVGLLLLNIPLPYYVTKPGMAERLHDMVNVEGEDHQAEGSFMLTTVRVGPSNVLQYLLAKVNDHQTLIPKEHLRLEGESNEQYHERQLLNMEGAQTAAVVAAFEKANKSVTVTKSGVLVAGLIPEMPAGRLLEIGDTIKAVNQEPVKEHHELLDKLGNLADGETVELTIERLGTVQDVTVTATTFPEAYSGGEEKVGIGIMTATKQKVVSDPEITFKTEDIGGPSAGLMFSLEIYNQLTESDWTKGYEIAGTGTIQADGTVGEIGGIEHKIIAADRSGADIFFAPIAGGNADEAIEMADELNTSMEVVPVHALDEALKYLEQVDEKGAHTALLSDDGFAILI